MLRADQAWHALRGFSRLSVEKTGDGISVLSSDLKSATDAIPFSTSRVLLKGFIEALGHSQWLWLVDLVDERNIFTEDGDMIHLKRGIMMGEPLSKTVLVLLTLCAEEIAYSEELGVSLRREGPTENLGWRAFHVGGDDHLAIGPKSYLHRITSNQKALGSLISPEKHRISEHLVVYTERVLHFTGKVINQPVEEVIRNPNNSIFVDSVKLRLLSPFTKALEAVNDKNVASGKIKGISSGLEYYPDGSTKKLVLDRALYKFKDFILGPHHRTIRAIESLPVTLGGLGLAQDTKYLANLPPIFNRAVRSICLTGKGAYLAQTVLGSIFENSHPRGVHSRDFIREWISNMVDNLDYFPIGSLTEWFQQLDPSLPFRLKLKRLEDNNVVSLSRLPQIIERSFIFRRLLENPPIGNAYRTDNMRKRVAQAWGDLEKLESLLHPDGSILSSRELQTAVKTSKRGLLINLNEVYKIHVEHMDSDGESEALFVSRTVKQVLAYGQPSMTVDLKTLHQY
jgi:hypothetical protein